jgi:hypothetical protein
MTTVPAVVSQIIDGIMQFHEALTGHAFYTYQTVFCRRILEALLLNTGDTITGLWSRQSGKTTAVAELNVTAAVLLPVLARAMPHIEYLKQFEEGLRIGIFAPVQGQAQLSYDRMRTVVHSARGEEILDDPEIDTEVETSRGDTLELSTGSLVHAKTASPDSKIEGFTYHIILIDEAQGADRFKVEKEIEPMRAATNGIMVKIGTAWISRGGFHSDIEYNVEHYKRGGPRNHFEFDYVMVCQEKRAAYDRTKNPVHLAYERYVQNYLKKHGESSTAFRMNFQLKWQEARMDAISARAMLDSMDLSRELNVMRPAGSDDYEWPRVAGIDVAKDNDQTVVTILETDRRHPIMIKDEKSGDVIPYYNSRVVGLLAIQGEFEDLPDGTPGQYTRIVRFLRMWHVQSAAIDATSMGDPVYERLTVLAEEIDFDPIHFSSSTKSDLFKHYLGEWESNRLKVASGGKSRELPEWQHFYEEHKTLEKSWNGQYLVCHAPEPTSVARKMPQQSEYHDDYPVSGALSCWAAKSELLGEIHVERPSSTAGRTHHSYATSSKQQRYGRRW